MAAELLPVPTAQLEPANLPKRKRSNPYRKKSLTQILELQQQAHAAALDPETPVKDRAALMRAWCDLQEEKRKLQMRPLPKPIDVSKGLHLRRAKASASGFIDPPAVQDKAGSVTNTSTEPPKPA